MDLSFRADEVIYPIFFWAAYLVACFVFTKECRKNGLPARDGWVLPLIITLGGRMGGLLLFSIEHDRWSTNPMTYLSFGMRWGSSQYGAIYGGILIFFLFSRFRRMSMLKLMDMGMPAITYAIAIGRLGCYFANCCRGFELPPEWQLPSFMPYNSHFPSALLTAIANFGIATYINRIPVKDETRGQRIGWWFILTTIERFLTEFVRESEVVWLGMTLVQLLAIPLNLMGVAILAGWHKPIKSWLGRLWPASE